MRIDSHFSLAPSYPVPPHRIFWKAYKLSKPRPSGEKFILFGFHSHSRDLKYSLLSDAREETICAAIQSYGWLHVDTLIYMGETSTSARIASELQKQLAPKIFFAYRLGPDAHSDIRRARRALDSLIDGVQAHTDWPSRLDAIVLALNRNDQQPSSLGRAFAIEFRKYMMLVRTHGADALGLLSDGMCYEKLGHPQSVISKTTLRGKKSLQKHCLKHAPD